MRSGRSCKRGRVLCLLLDCCPSWPLRKKAPSACRGSRQGSPALLLRFAGLPRAARGAHVHQLARVAAPDVRLDAVGAHEVLLKDLADYGNAGALAAPHSMLVFDVAPLSHAFETFPASERMYIADEPRAGPRGARRHLVRGGPALAAIFPGQGRAAAAESRNAALQLPDGPALHRAALVPRRGARYSWRPGWAAGSAARRAATTKWCSARWCGTTPTSTIRWASCRAARRSTSRSAANAYLYGTRFFTWLAYTLFAREGRRVASGATKAANATTLIGSSRSSASRSSRPGGLDRVRARVPAAEPRRVRKFPITPQRNLAASAIGSVSRMYYDEASGILYGGVPLSRRGRACRRAEHARRQRASARRHQAGDALPRRIVRLRPRQRDAVLHQRQPGRCAT